MVEESEERLSEEQIEELIQAVAVVLPGDPEQENAAPADAEMVEGGEQSWHSDRPQLTHRRPWSQGQTYYRAGLVAFYLRCFLSLFELNTMQTEGMHNC